MSDKESYYVARQLARQLVKFVKENDDESSLDYVSSLLSATLQSVKKDSINVGIQVAKESFEVGYNIAKEMVLQLFNTTDLAIKQTIDKVSELKIEE